MKYNNYIYKLTYNINSIIDGILLLILYLIGLCRYRSALVLSIIMFIRVINDVFNRKVLFIVFAPIFVIAFYFDIKLGQYFPIYTNLNPLISILIFVITEFIIVEYIKKRLPSIIGNEIFVVCPICHFNNDNPISVCRNCRYVYDTLENYKKVDINNYDDGLKIDNNITSEINFTKFNKSISKIKKIALNLHENETIIANISISPFRGVYKNGVKLYIDSLVITQYRIILIKFGFTDGGWKIREDIPITDIISSNVQNKWHHTKKVNLLVCQLINNDIYELFYSPFATSLSILELISDYIKLSNKS